MMREEEGGGRRRRHDDERRSSSNSENLPQINLFNIVDGGGKAQRRGGNAKADRGSIEGKRSELCAECRERARAT